MDTREIRYKLTDTHRLLSYSDIQRYSCLLTCTYAHALRRKTLLAKQMLRKYLDTLIYIHSHRHIFGQLHTWLCTHMHTLHLKTDFLIPQFLQVSYDLIYFSSHTVIFCHMFSQNHAVQKHPYVYICMVLDLTKVPLHCKG